MFGLNSDSLLNTILPRSISKALKKITYRIKTKRFICNSQQKKEFRWTQLEPAQERYMYTETMTPGPIKLPSKAY